MEFSRKMRGKSFLFIPFLSFSFLNLLPDDPFSRSFSVIFGRFCGHSWRKSENIGEKWRHLSVFIPFLSISFHFIPSPPQITPILCSKTYSLQILLKFLAFFLAVPIILRTFATVYKMIVIYPAGRPFRLWLLAAGFFYA